LEGNNQEGKKLLVDGKILKPDFIGFFAADWTPEWMTAFGRFLPIMKPKSS